MFTSRIWLGIATIAYAVAFNIPFSILGSTFDYPHILRQPAGDVLTRFAAGGGGLILTWYGFMLAALLLLPVSTALALNKPWVSARPALAIGAALAGGLSALAQAIGLSRWVFVIPGLARDYIDGAATETSKALTTSTFTTLNSYGGVAIGEHIGQLLITLFLIFIAVLQFADRLRLTAVIAFIAAAAILIGTGEGLAIALGQNGDTFGAFTIVGFLVLTLWLIVTGIGLIRYPETPAR